MSLLGNRNLCSLTLLLVLCALTLAGCGKSDDGEFVRQAADERQ